MNDLFTFIQRSCADYAFTAQTFWEESVRDTGKPLRQRANSDTLNTTNEVLVTTLAVCSNWVPDAMVRAGQMNDDQIDECQICLIPFSFLVRKHHCRSCGRVVCSMCSKYKMVFKGEETPYRVCCSCYFDYKKDCTASLLLISSAIHTLRIHSHHQG